MFRAAAQIFLWSCFIISTTSSSAQQVTDTIGDIDAPVDTAEFYKKIYSYSKDRKLIYLVYRAIFNPPAQKAKARKKPKSNAIPEKKYRGKIIRNIQIISLDPFGTNINDTTNKELNFIQRAGNTLHVESRKRTIKNYLQFRERDRIDPLALQESERLLRATTFIREAKITVQPVAGTRDSFDILVLTQDYWSIKFAVDATSSRIRYRVTEENMLGFGHEFDNRITDKLNESFPLILDGSYTIPTLGNTFISPKIYYGTGPDNNIRGIEINRPFYSPLTRVAGGLDLLTFTESDSIRFSDETLYNYTFRSNVFDTWLGYSIKLSHGETVEERSTRIISAVRYARVRYPKLQPDLERFREFYSRSDFYLASLSLSSRKYLRERYVLKFGEVEDVPEGDKITFTTGIEDRYNGTHLYFGVDGAISRYFPSVGYVYLGTGYSTFVKSDSMYRSSITGNVIYFSPLVQFGKWRARQFASLDFLYGINRKEDELLRLNTEIGLPGYKSELPFGTSKMVLVGQSVFYTPYVFLGFRFAPIIIVGAGLVGDYNSSLFKSKLYQMYGVGILIKNELLVLNTFQLTVALYPVLPEGGAGIKFNPVSLNEKRFKDFDISRPDVSPFE